MSGVPAAPRYIYDTSRLSICPAYWWLPDIYDTSLLSICPAYRRLPDIYDTSLLSICLAYRWLPGQKGKKKRKEKGGRIQASKGAIYCYICCLQLVGIQMEHVTIEMGEKSSNSQSNKIEKSTKGRDGGHSHKNNRDEKPGTVLWIDGLICAFEFVDGRIGSISSTSAPKTPIRKEAEAHIVNGLSVDSSRRMDSNKLLEPSSLPKLSYSDNVHNQDGHWVPIGWNRVSELVQMLQSGADWPGLQLNDEDSPTVEDLAAPFHEQPAEPTWWCHVDANHSSVKVWLTEATWLRPDISSALTDKNQQISERTKHLFYQLPTRVAGGLLFELFGYATGESFDTDSAPIFLRSWQARNFLLTAMHLHGNNRNIFGIKEVQELLSLGGHNAPRTVAEVIAQLVHSLARWDDRLFHKCISKAADDLEGKFMSRMDQKGVEIFCFTLNRDTKELAQQVTKMGWSLQQRDEIVFELLKHFRVHDAARTLLLETRTFTKEMMDKRETIRARLFIIQDLLQNIFRGWLQDKSATVTHNLSVFGGCGVVLSLVTGVFGANFDGIPGAKHTPYAFGLFVAMLFLTGAVLTAVGLLCLCYRGSTELEIKKREEDIEKREHERVTETTEIVLSFVESTFTY